jgi:hypothetical protein
MLLQIRGRELGGVARGAAKGAGLASQLAAIDKPGIAGREGFSFALLVLLRLVAAYWPTDTCLQHADHLIRIARRRGFGWKRKMPRVGGAMGAELLQKSGAGGYHYYIAYGQKFRLAMPGE